MLPSSDSTLKTRSSSSCVSKSTKMELDGVKENSCSIGLSEHMNSRPQRVKFATLMVPVGPGSASVYFSIWTMLESGKVTRYRSSAAWATPFWNIRKGLAVVMMVFLAYVLI